MVQRLGLSALAVVFVLAISAAEAAAWCVRGVATGDTLRMRHGPGARNPAVGQIPSRACGVNVVGPCRGAWCVVSWRGRVGWANAEYLSRMPDRTARKEQTARAKPPQRKPPVARNDEPETKDRADQQTRAVAIKAVPPVEAKVDAAAKPDSQPEAQPAAAAAAEPSPPPQTPTAPEPPAIAAADRHACVTGIAAGETLKVRAGPGPDQALRFGYLPGTCGVRITGACKDGWCPVDYRGYQGWAEERFLK